MSRQPNLFVVAVTTAAALSLSSSLLAAEKRTDAPSTSASIEDFRPSRELTESRDTMRLVPGVDTPKWFDSAADLEATSIQFLFEYHFGADQVYDTRVVAEITNVDSAWSGWSRTWEIYRIAPNVAPHGVVLVDTGLVPALAPGETDQFTVYLPNNVDLNSTYVLILSPGDANPSNDIAVDVP